MMRTFLSGIIPPRTFWSYNLMSNRTTPEWIDQLKPDEIFVFGSNLSGIHGAGAAKLALRWGARMGVGEGLSGQTYALPTVRHRIAGPLSLEQVEQHVRRFTDVARLNPNLKFLVTEVGCGLAGFQCDQIGPLFADAYKLNNVWLPKRFL